MHKPYEVINHTADIGIRVCGNNLNSLFLNAACAMFEIILEPQKKRGRFEKIAQTKFVVNKQSSNLEELFVAWLGELLYLFSVEGLIMQKADIQKLDANSIQADVVGQIFNPEFHKIKTEIKAVTYHGLKIAKQRRGYQAEVIFDV